MKRTAGGVSAPPSRNPTLPEGARESNAAASGSSRFKAEGGNAQGAKARRILGIDPGLASTGWGVIDVAGNKFRHVAHGVVETESSDAHQLRLLAIYNRILAVVQEFAPTEASMEALYFAKNVTSGLAVAEARGVLTLCLAQNAVPLAEYSPLSIKQCVVGSAKAEKRHIQEYVKLLLGLPQIPRPDHAADALAAAITHANSAASG